MADTSKSTVISKAKEAIGTVKEYWSTPAKGNYIPYKEVVSLSGAGFGVHWTTLLASTIALNASNFLVGASIGLIISTVFFRKVKERLILPKKKPEPVRMLDALREVAKNKYYWIIQAAAWVVFLESGYGVVLGWSFVYGHGGEYESSLGLANTVIGNAALWSMLPAPLAIKKMGKRNLLITANSINIVVLIVFCFTYQNLLFICILWYFNTFINTFWNIFQHNISADMRDYHQWKTGVRVDGLFGPLGMTGTFLSFFTGMVYPAIYEKMGLLEDYNVLYDDSIRNNILEVLIICSAFGALLNLIPFCFYDLTENEHRAYVDVLKIRAMFENHALGVLDDSELEEAMEIILQAKQLNGQEKLTSDKSALKAARKLPHRDDEEKQIRSDAIKAARIRYESATLIRKYGIENIKTPDESEKQETINRETHSFIESIKLRQELRVYLKNESIYSRIVKPYINAESLIKQANYYTHYEELENRYFALQAEKH